MEGSDFTPISETLNDKKLFSVTNGKEASAGSMMVWKPHGNKFFETFSYLPPLTEEQIAKQVQYLLNNGYTPCLEFEDAQHGYAERWTGLDFSVNAGYYDNRYWVMWKLPMYGCTNTDEVLAECKACKAAFPNCYVRVAGFDNIKQVQCASFLVARPPTGAACAVNARQV